MPLLARALTLIAPPFCWACGSGSRPAEPLCAPCRSELRWLGGRAIDLGGLEAWAPVAYEGPARALVVALKFRGATGLASPMAAQIAAGVPQGLLDRRAALVPVPLHPARARRRGFNQAERLAAQLARRTGAAMEDCLCRRGHARRQVGLGRSERLAAIEGALELRPGVRAPARVVLVDDVVTTGATLHSCAAALRAGGTRHVCALAYARTSGR